MTTEEVNQAEIEVFTSLLRSALSQVAVLRRELEKRGVKLKPVEFFQIVDESSHTVYNDNCRFGCNPLGLMNREK